ncbi:MAG: hypothetical protein ACFBSC_17555 [Microcoleaceae cyanobacterium]
MPPAESANLEQRLISAIESSEYGLNNIALTEQLGQRYLKPLRIALALTAGLLVTWIGYGVMKPSQLSLAEQQQLEDFIVSNWNDVMTENPDSGWLDVLTD